MTRYHAAWVVPISVPPIRNGWVDLEDGVISGFGSSIDCSPQLSFEVNLGSSIIMPGLTNAHTHLELSGLKGLISRAESMPSWARQVITLTNDKEFKPTTIATAADSVYQSGTALVGDISNTLASVEPLRKSSLDGVIFKEFLGFNERSQTELLNQSLEKLIQNQGDGPRLSLAAHAPYSVSPSLFMALREVADNHSFSPLSVHLAESQAELEFLSNGTGPWRDILEERGRWDPMWTCQGECPVSYLDRMGWMRAETLVVHGVHLTASELDRLASVDATIVTCPRSNLWTGAGIPPISQFYASGVRVALGTDSLASAEDLNLFSEIHEVRKLAPEVPASLILRSATLNGAEALGFYGEYGAITVGRRCPLIAVSDAVGTNDVEEYLVSGIQPEQVKWLES
jgi:cytosine/adenosine deaminase-related metal-dependent hydrolase